MAITLSELTEKIDDKWHQFLVTEGTDLLEISVDTTTYVHTSGSKSLPIIFKLEEEGSYLKRKLHSAADDGGENPRNTLWVGPSRGLLHSWRFG
jgi:hypothetical protein